MPRLTDLYSGTETLTLAGGLTVTLKKELSEDDFRAASDALMSNRQYVETNGRTEVRAVINTSHYNRILVLRGLVSWNLEDDRGQVLPIHEVNLSKLPQHVFRQILDRVLALNQESQRSPEDEATFPASSADSDKVPEDGESAA